MVPSWLQAIVLGLVQGATEFIPVSSSGHLTLVPYLFGWERPGLAFDVALHAGSIVAIVAFFWRELWAMASGLVRGGHTPEARLYRKLAVLFVLASIPVAIVGLAFRGFIEQVFASPPAAAVFLFGTAAILVGGERWRSIRIRRTGAAVKAHPEREPRPPRAKEPDPKATSAVGLPVGHDPHDPAGKTLEQVGVREALIVGLAQCLALLPGVSRSGTTIMAGVAAGLTRAAATRFAFLLLLPALVGATLVSIGDLGETDVYTDSEIAMGVLASAIASYLAIRFLVVFVAGRRLTPFAVYCAAAGSVGVVGAFLIG